MDYRRRSSSAALLALGALGLASLLAGGCAAPKNSEKARFGLVSGVVSDPAGNPVAGARVTIVDKATPTSIGTRNYYGPRGPFVTNARGRFAIDGVLAGPNDTVVLNFRVEKEGFLPSTLGHLVNEATDVPGANRVIPAGAQTPDIVVNATAILDLTATLATQAPATQVSVSGATIQTPVPQVTTQTVAGQAPPPPPAAPASISIPAGALTQSTPISITPIVTANQAAPVTYSVASPATVVAPANTVIAGLSAGAVDLQPEGLTFPATARPTVRMPLSLSLADVPAGTHLPVNWFNPATGAWEYAVEAVVEAQNGAAVAVFQVSHFSTYECAIPVKWEFGAVQFNINGVWQSGPQAVGDINQMTSQVKQWLKDHPATGPLSGSPRVFANSDATSSTGSLYAKWLPFGLSIDPVRTAEQLSFLMSSYEHLSRIPGSANGMMDVRVPADTSKAKSFVVAVETRYPVKVTVQLSLVSATTGPNLPDRLFAGQYSYWTLLSTADVHGQDLQQVVNPTVPSDVIDHLQGGGIEF